MTKLLYLHGFQSSNKSAKAAELASWLAQRRVQLVVPELSPFPAEAIAQAEQLIERENFKGIIGSSLGGYYATYLGSKYALLAVVVNPGVFPYVLLKDYLGENTNPYTGNKYVLTDQHMDELMALKANPANVWLLQQKGDETLDYREAVEHYKNCKTTLEEGGDHAFVGFDRFFEPMLQFFGIELED